MLEDLKNAHKNLSDNELYAIPDHWWLVEGRMQKWLGGAMTKEIESRLNTLTEKLNKNQSHDIIVPQIKIKKNENQ